MRKITITLLSAAYICVALTVAVLMWRSGGGWGAGLSSLIGALGLAFALHAIISRSIDRAALSAEIGAVRDAHMLLVRQIEQMRQSIQGVGATVNEDVARRSEQLSSEVRMLESLVQRISEDIEDRMSAPVAAPAGHGQASGQAAVTPLRPQQRRQGAQVLQDVRAALAQNRVDLYLQPIVSLPQRRTQYYESFSRLRDESGRIMMPAEYLAAAEPAGLVSAIDNLLLFRCVQIVRRLAKQDRKVGIFCNISLASLADETFFPQFIEFLAENRDAASGVIFELGQSAFEQRGATEARNMAKLADLGFRFSLDKVADLALDFTDLSRADVKFLKISGQVMIEQLLEQAGSAQFRDIDPADFVDLCGRHGLEVIVEKIESERQVVDVLELNVAFGQGNLFGEPRAIREAVLTEADPPAEFIRNTLRQRAAASW
jgi:cyclic-di-GMP phosphodiesterase TipF (flagellum assembly factor)